MCIRDRSALAEVKARLQSQISPEQPTHCISAATGEGTDALMQALMRRLDDLWQSQQAKQAKEEQARNKALSDAGEPSEEPASDEPEP